MWISRRLPGQLYLWIAILIFGAANSVIRRLTEIGAENLIDGRNPVSLCNVLFVGNICALMVLIIIYGREWKAHQLKQITQKEWRNLTLVTIFSSAIAPALIFQSLALTMVNNVVLVGRLEPPLALILSIWLLQERVNFWQILGAFVSFVGVILTIFLQPATQDMLTMMSFNIGKGEIFTATAAIIFAVSTIISKTTLSQVPLGIYNIFRTALGTVIFFFFALLLYGHSHFMDVFSPFLWKWMLIYGPVIVVVGQLSWIVGLKVSTVSQVSLVSSFAPVAGVVAAYLILGEVPTTAQYIGGAVILVGIIISQIGIRLKQSLQAKTSRINSTQKLQEVENTIGFKGM